MKRNRVHSITIRKLPSGSYQLRHLDPKTGKRTSLVVARTKREADQTKSQLLHQMGQGTFGCVTDIAFNDFVTEHVAGIAGKSHAEGARHTLEQFGQFTGVAGVADITYGVLEDYVQQLRQQRNKAGKAINSVATIRKKLGYVRTALNKAVKRDYISKNVMDGGLWPKAERKIPRTLKPYEQDKLIEEAGKDKWGDRWALLIRTAIETGGRRGELIGLTWGRVDFSSDPSTAHFTSTKSHQDRRVPLRNELADALQRLQVQTLADGGPFLAFKGDAVSKTFKRIATAAGVAGCSFHDLRRTCCKNLLDAGVPPTTVQRILGHYDINTTLTYYNSVDQADFAAAVAKMDQAATTRGHNTGMKEAAS